LAVNPPEAKPKERQRGDQEDRLIGRERSQIADPSPAYPNAKKRER
jgi:hypothetical protein